MSSLRRVKAGDYSIEDAVTIEDIQNAADENRLQDLIRPVDTLFSAYEALIVPEHVAQKIKCGNDAKVVLVDGMYRVYAPNGEFLAFCMVENITMHTIKSFFEV